ERNVECHAWPARALLPGHRCRRRHAAARGALGHGRLRQQRRAAPRSMGEIGPMSTTIEVSLWRGKADGRYQSYRVPLRESQTVLDVVTWVQRNADPTLAYRFACRVGMCGSCAMTVNGRPRWTCRTHTSKVVEDGRLEIGPLANLPIIKDLACDMQPFFEKWQKAKGAFRPSASRRRAPSGSPSTPPSSASTAPYATRLATRCAGMRTIWAPPPSIAPGPSSTTCATAAAASASLPSPRTAAATPATPTRAARSIVPRR